MGQTKIAAASAWVQAYVPDAEEQCMLQGFTRRKTLPQQWIIDTSDASTLLPVKLDVKSHFFAVTTLGHLVVEWDAKEEAARAQGYYLRGLCCSRGPKPRGLALCAPRTIIQ